MGIINYSIKLEHITNQNFVQRGVKVLSCFISIIPCINFISLSLSLFRSFILWLCVRLASIYRLVYGWQTTNK